MVANALRARRCYATTGERIVGELWVDGIFMGGERPAGEAKGRHEVRFRYEPASFRLGSAISLIAAGALFVALWWGQARK